MKINSKIIAEILIVIACIVISIWLFKIIYNSNMPMWLKWLLLR